MSSDSLDETRLAVFALSSGAPLAERVCRKLGVELGRHEERDFEDGEHKIRPLESVRGRDVYLVQSLYGDAELTVNDKLCRVLFFLGALRDAGAARLTAVLPYLCYARKDRRTKPRDPVTSRYVAALLEAAGIDRVVTVDVHNRAAFDNAFRVPAVHLTAQELFVDRLERLARGHQTVVVSPDAGGIKRAERFRTALEERLEAEVGAVFLEKYRSEGVVSGSAVVGEVGDRLAIVLDDLVSTGGTLRRAATACRERGARAVVAAATHGVFVGDAAVNLADPALDRTFVLDTIPVSTRLPAEVVESHLTVLCSAPLLAAAIARLHC